MRRATSSDKTDSSSTMADSTATRSGYRAVPTTEGYSRPSAPSSSPVYGTATKPPTRTTHLCFALSLLALSLFALAFVADMPLADRLKAAFFNKQQPTPPLTTDMDVQAVHKLNAFGLSLFARLAGSPAAAKDVVVSPASISYALTMAAAGTTQGSAAEKELDAVLGQGLAAPGGSSDRAVQFVVANSAWVSGTVKPEYKHQVKNTFAAQVEPLPDDAAPVNAWVNKYTKGNIDKILDAIPPNVVALLVNAVFFKASWKTKFDPKNTREQPFYADGGRETEVARVRMMRLTKETFPYAEVPFPGNTAETLQVVELPYGSMNEYAATIVVPKGKTTIAQVADLFNGGSATIWDEWVGKLVSRKLDVMAMPRFKVAYGAKSLKGELQDIGVKTAFISDKDNPQFLRMSDDKETYLDDVLHKATIECTEEGTVASAATAVLMMTRSAPRENPRVVLDRPFMFAIRNRASGALIFLSRVDNPVSPS